MNARLSIRELAVVAVPGVREGSFLMLRAYFDDSATHADSSVTVIAGLIGTELNRSNSSASGQLI